MDHIYFSDMTPKMFYQDYLSVNKPVFVVEGAADWPALTKWQDQEFMATQIKKTQSLNLEWEHLNERTEVTTVQTEEEVDIFNQKVQLVMDHGLNGFDFSDGIPFFKNLWVTRNEKIINTLRRPQFMEIFSPVRDYYFSHTSLKSHRMQKTNAVQLDGEVYVCQIQGRERFKLVAPVFKQNMYSGIREELPPGVSPVDLFHEPKAENIKRFPLLK